MNAIGSLLPLSNSSKGRILFLRETPFDLSIEKTDAESVEDIIEANNIDSGKVKEIKLV